MAEMLEVDKAGQKVRKRRTVTAVSAVDGGGLGLSGGAGAGGVEVPGQQFGDTTDRMVCDAAEDVVQIGLGVEAIEFGGLCRPPNYAERAGFLQDSSSLACARRGVGVIGATGAEDRPGTILKEGIERKITRNRRDC
jgi:hypothetical protein